MTTDGAEDFATANRKEFYSRYADKNTEHIKEIAFNGKYHNNLGWRGSTSSYATERR